VSLEGGRRDPRRRSSGRSEIQTGTPTRLPATVTELLDPWAAWPETLTDFLRGAYGRPLAVEPLGGMSVARVYRVRFSHRSLIVKTSPRPAEARFYERVAPRLRDAGVPIPRLECVAHLLGAHWLVLEDIPAPLPVPPLDRWRPDPRVITVLARLHRVTHEWPPDVPESHTWAWTDRITDRALTCFPADIAAELAPTLRTLQYEAAHLADGWCWISGDASPPNWGVRPGGGLALFDWELYRPGLPAADLAPTVPGLPSPDRFRQTAACYLDAWREVDGGLCLPWSLEALARDIAVAKAVTVVMLLRAHADKLARVPDEVVKQLVETVPPWLQRLR
jgi:aminoglycoside phosphotransferase (APT) family kinase protein